MKPTRNYYYQPLTKKREKQTFGPYPEVTLAGARQHRTAARALLVQARGALETVRRLCQRINDVMIYAMNVGLIDAAPSVNISKAFEKPQKKHIPSIRPAQLPQLMRQANIELSTRCLFMWQLLTLPALSEPLRRVGKRSIGTLKNGAFQPNA